MNKFANSDDNSAVPPKPPTKNLSKQSSQFSNKPNKSELEIVRVTPPNNDSNLRDIQSADLAGSSTPIPPPNNTLQYRAIGVILARYMPSSEHFCKGKLTALDGTVIEAVVLGKVMPILQKKLDLEQAYLWVVYPRTVEKTSQLYMQISGVWAPKETGKPDLDLDPNVEDGYFSIRGEVIEQSIARNYVVVKIKRSDREKKLPKARTRFKLKLKGILPSSAIGYFWDIKVQRQNHSLIITYAKAIAVIPKKPPKKPVRRAISSSSELDKPFDMSKALTSDRPTPPVKRSKF